MAKQFDILLTDILHRIDPKGSVSLQVENVKPVEPVIEQKPLVESSVVEAPKTPKKRTQLTLVAQVNPLEDPSPITVESITKLGFELAPKDDFIGATDKTYFKDIDNANGRATVVYDFQPLGNHGKPAAHVYYNANNSQISESLVCFNAPGTVGELNKLIESVKTLNPTESKSIHTIENMQMLIEQVNNCSKPLTN